MIRTVMLALVLAALVLFPVRAGEYLPAADEYQPQKLRKKPTRWKIRIEGDKHDYLVPIPVAQEFGLKPGATVTVKKARLIAMELGADYPPEILSRLEELAD